MKRFKRIYKTKAFRRAVAFLTALLLTINTLPLESADIDLNIDLSFLTEMLQATADDTQPTYLTADEFNDFINEENPNVNLDTNSIVINNTKLLILFSNLDPSEYQNMDITIALNQAGDDFNLSNAVTGNDGKSYSYLGLGDEANPFKGTLNVYQNLTASQPLFNYICDSVEISSSGTPLTITAGDEFCLFKNVVHNKDEGATPQLSVDQNVIQIKTQNGKIAGIIDTLGSGAEVTVNPNITDGTGNDGEVINTLTVDSANAGLFCNTMEDGSKLTVSGFTYNDSAGNAKDTSSVIVNATSGNAGGAVGKMGAGAELVFSDDFTFKGTVKAASANDDVSAGGIVGMAEENAKITVNDEKTLTVDSATVSGKTNTGGLVGSYTYDKSKLENSDTDIKPINYDQIEIKDVTLSTSSIVGGVFGALTNNGGTFTVSGTKDNYFKVAFTSNKAAGGVIGTYTSNALTNTLKVEYVETDGSYNVDKNYGAGIIYKIADNNAYVNISNVTVSNQTAATAGLVHNAGKGNMLDIGNVEIKGKNNLNSGLVQSMESGVIRLDGKTDLSGIGADGTTSNSYGQILGTRTGGTVVYATKNWEFVRKTDSKLSDIGSYGEVVRLKSSVIEETKEAFKEGNTTELFYFNEAEHTVTVANVDPTSISTPKDFAALSVTSQVMGKDITYDNKTSGALQLSKTDLNIQSKDLTITLADNIDMTGTGVTGLTRDDDTQTFKGTFDGKDYKLTLAIGEAYGCKIKDNETVSVDSTDYGVGQIYNHGYIGLFGRTEGATVKNVTVDGTANFGRAGNIVDVYAGAVSGVSAGTLNMENAVNELKITCCYSDASRSTYIGGFVGYFKAGTLTTQNCKWNGTITNNCNNDAYVSVGGFVGFVNNGEKAVTVNSSDDTVSGTITLTNDVGNAVMGGFIGSTSETTDTIKTNNFKITNMAISGANVTCSSSKDGGTCGGLLGYKWFNTNAEINGLTVKGSSVSANGRYFGGLVYRASGYWNISGKGISFEQGTDENGKTINNTFSGKSDSTATDTDTHKSTTSALLVARGDDVDDKGCALYLEIGLNGNTTAYTIEKDSVNVTLSGSADYFDEIVGRTITDGVESNGNGIVSIATDSHALIDTSADSCNTYRKQLTNDYDNPNTRYYYNLDEYCGKSDTDLTDGAKLLLWSVNKYAESNINSYFTNYFTNNNITGAIDLTGYSYYPITLSENVSISGATITFDNETIESKEENNKQPSDSDRQHYMMHYGVIYNYSASGTADTTLSVDGLTLAGTVGKNGDEGSGALVCGTVDGHVDSNDKEVHHKANIVINTLTLSNLSIRGFDNDDYAPLLINKIASYTNVQITGLSTNGYDNTAQVSTSLIGNVGSDTARGLGLSFSEIALDSHVETSLFTEATLIQSFMYAGDSYGMYNFTEENDKAGKVTYGQEISNTNSGRNPTLQYYYYGTETEVTDKYQNDSYYNGKTVADYFSNKSVYLRYVGTVEDSANNTHELDINQAFADLLEGCGTYGDPYIINTGLQLETLAKILADQPVSSDIIVDTNIFGDDKTADDSTAKLSGFSYDENNYHTSESKSTHRQISLSNDTAKDRLKQYLSNAYYEIDGKIELGSGFDGLGADKGNCFSGVIIGKNDATIEVTVPDDTIGTYGGLIKYAGGCVVKDLTIDVDGTITLESPASGSDNTERKTAFFGGVIGYAYEGDNIIDTVKVNTDNLTISCTDTNVSIGAYVGLVGGGSNGTGTAGGGGVVFRNIDSETGLKDLDSNYYYRNPFVGRVADGYVCSEDCELKNTDTNYEIPQLDTSDKLTFGDYTIDIADEQQLWILSAIVNSGAGSQGVIATDSKDTSKGSHSDSYSLGKVRAGDYDNIGKAYTEAKSDLKDEKYWGGNNNPATDKYSYIIQNYVEDGQDYAAQCTTNTISFDVTIENDLDMSKYGNGFRGIGAAYQDNVESYTIYRTLRLNTVNGNNYKVTLNRNVKEYQDEDWWIQCLGLFPIVNFNGGDNDSTVENLTISGNIKISYKDGDTNNYVGECSSGGFAGMTVNYGSSKSKTTTFSNVKTNGLSVTGSKYAGGFIAVVGQSSRTIKGEQLQDVSKTAGNFTFSDCGYDNLTVEGGYGVGGFVGVYRNGTSYTFAVKGKTEIGTNSTENSIKLTKDSGKDVIDKVDGYAAKASDNDSKKSDAAKKDAYTGAGGILGYCYGVFNVNYYGSKQLDEKENYVKLENTTVSSVQICFNVDYGMGGIIGTVYSAVSSENDAKTIYMYNITVDKCTVKTDVKEGFTGAFADKAYYLTLPAGGVAGQVAKMKSVIGNITVQNSNILDCGYVGGVYGRNEYTCTGKDITVKDTIVFTQGTATYNGPVMAGGVIGRPDGNVTFTNCTVDGVTVFSDGYSGGFGGSSRKVLSFTNLTIKDCKIVTDNMYEIVDKTYYLIGNTDPGDKSGKVKGKNSQSGANEKVRDNHSSYACAGGIIGDMAINGTSKMNGYNILMDKNLIGYYLKENNGSYTNVENKPTERKVSVDEMSSLSEDNIGVAVTSTEFKPYSKVDFTSSQKNDAGYDGIIVGDKNTANGIFIKIAGLSVQGDYVPCEYNGGTIYTDKSKLALGTDGYVIRSDYTGAATTASEVTTKPDSVINGLTTTVTTDGAAWNTVDTQSVGQKIIADLTEGDDGKIAKYNKTYYYVKDLVNNKDTKFDTTKLTTFKTVTDSSGVDDVTDFPVLLIDTNDSETITNLVLQYASILTDWDETSTTKIYSTMTTATYQWDANQGEFKKINDSTLNYDTTNKKLKVNSGKYDNQKSQFTVVTVKYTSPTNKNVYYSLQIPVLVKKVLEYSFSATTVYGANYYPDAYKDIDAAALANNGEAVTAYVTFKYLRDTDTWQTYLDSGENLLLNFDKTVLYDNSKNSLPAGTQIVLVDPNPGGKSQAFYYTLKSDGENVSFSQFTDADDNPWRPTSFSDLLNVQLADDSTVIDENSIFQKCTDSNKKNATVKVGNDYYMKYDNTLATLVNNQKWGSTPTTQSELTEISNGVYTMLTIDPTKIDNDNKVTENKLTYITESYYITIITPKDSEKTTSSQVNIDGNNGTYKTMGALYTDQGTEDKTSTIATDYKSETLNANTYIIGPLYSQEITVTGDDITEMTVEKNTIKAGIEIKVTKDTNFDTYTATNAGVHISHGLDFSLLRYDGSNETVETILSSSNVKVTSYRIGDTEYLKNPITLNSTDGSKITFDDISEVDFKTFMTNLGKGVNEFTIYVDAVFTAEDVSGQFENATREDDSTQMSENGIALKVTSKLSTGKSYISANDQTDNHYYILDEKTAKLVYSAESDVGAEDLGINPYESEKDYTVQNIISTDGTYDVPTSLMSLYKDYDKLKVKYTLKLLKKVSTEQYVPVNIDDYLSDITIDEGDVVKLDDDSGVYVFTKDWEKTQSSDRVNIRFTVNTGSEFEEKGYTYANYQVQLSAEICDEDGNSLSDQLEADDHIIYTNARIYLGLIATPNGTN